jgi:hypothetical protein
LAGPRARASGHLSHMWGCALGLGDDAEVVAGCGRGVRLRRDLFLFCPREIVCDKIEQSQCMLTCGNIGVESTLPTQVPTGRVRWCSATTPAMLDKTTHLAQKNACTTSSIPASTLVIPSDPQPASLHPLLLPFLGCFSSSGPAPHPSRPDSYSSACPSSCSSDRASSP